MEFSLVVKSCLLKLFAASAQRNVATFVASRHKSKAFWSLTTALLVASQTVDGMAASRDTGEKSGGIRLETRAAGNYVDGGSIQPQRSSELTISKDMLVEAKLFDHQYGKEVTYRGVPLNDSVTAAAKGADLALFHFENGMIVPVPLSAGSSDLQKISPFLAIEIKTEQGKWSSEFPGLAKRSEDFRFRDPRPLLFHGNKIVVKSLWHPFPPLKGEKGFSPWRFVNSLTKIEFVKRDAYYRQFEVAESPAYHEGMKVFFERCQFCHGVRQIGASYGWDYVDPLPIYKQKSPEHLHLHAQVPKIDAMERGLMMPAQKDFSEKEAKALWEWMKMEAEGKLKAYQP